MKKKELPKVEPVHIKPLFGLRPGLWLTIAYAVILIVFIFFFCFFPGIKRGGKRVTFTSQAYNSAVYLDGTYLGGTPFTNFVSTGIHKVEYKINNVSIDSFEIRVGHPVFLTWMFPRKMSVNSSAVLNQSAYEALLKEFVTDLGTYSAIMEYDDVFRYKPLYTDFAKTVQTSSYMSQLATVLENTACFVTSKEMLEDYKNACEIANTTSTVSESQLQEETFAKRDLAHYSIKEGSNELLTIGTINIVGKNNGEFTISQTGVPETLYAIFVKENPKWALSNKDNLIKEGLADEYYLSDVNLSTSVRSNKEIKNISWYSAKAFCEWLSGKTGKQVNLPSEKQWIESSLETENWNLTNSFFIPHISDENSPSYKFALSTNAALECIVKKTALEVGTFPLNMCSDYMSFRIIWY